MSESKARLFERNQDKASMIMRMKLTIEIDR